MAIILKKSNNEYFKALILQVPLHEPKHLEYKENKSEIFINKYEHIKTHQNLNNYGKKGIKYTYYHKI